MSFSFKAGELGGFDPDLARAAAVADWYQTRHRDYHFAAHSFSETRAALSHFDEPIGVYDAVFAYWHSQAISEHCQVLLTGSGADEIFGGYSSYLEYCPAHSARFEYTAKDQIDRLLADEFNRVARKDAELLYEGATELLANEIDSYECLRTVLRLGNYDNILDGKLFIELTAGMSHCASLFDMTGMAHGVEFRSAFFNHKILELGARMPPQWKVDRNHPFQTKLILKQAAAKVLPAHLFRDIVDSPKCGYGHALDRMSLIRGEWRAEIDAVLERNEPCLEGIIDPGKVRDLLARFQDPGMTLLEERRVLKLVLFLAWLDGQDLQEAS
jgi:asparagine synthase (glutamine-hydrolysing)